MAHGTQCQSSCTSGNIHCKNNSSKSTIRTIEPFKPLDTTRNTRTLKAVLVSLLMNQVYLHSIATLRNWLYQKLCCDVSGKFEDGLPLVDVGTICAVPVKAPGLQMFIFFSSMILIFQVTYFQCWTQLTYFWQMFPSYNPWEHQKAFGFLVFSGGMKWEHWPEMN